jgi:positive regulator of sigma E activity
MNNNFVSHSGIVQNIDHENIEVMIISESACSACKSKKVCTISDMKEKSIYLKTNNQSYKVGEKVNVIMEEKLGFYATIFAYVLPFILMISILLIGTYSKMSEPLMGILVIVFLVMYYLILYLFRKQFEKKMSFKIEKQNI